MSNLLDKLKKNSKIKNVAALEESEFFGNKESIPTLIPALNIALSGELDGGVTNGILQIAGESKHFKTSFALYIASAYLKHHKNGVMMFYDTEFGSTPEYFKNFDIDTSRVLHVPIKDTEELKFDLVSQLENITADDKVIIVIDSIGNLASKKEKEDALNEKAVADMSRAKQLKSLFRMVTPYLTINNIPLIAINHIYQEIGSMYSKKIASGGTGLYYSSNDIWFIGRNQNKDNNGEIAGYNFTINIEKSRRVREKSKIEVNVTWEGGVSEYSALLDLACEAKLVEKLPAGWYVDKLSNTDKKVRLKDLQTPEWKEALCNNSQFKQFVAGKYKI